MIEYIEMILGESLGGQILFPQTSSFIPLFFEAAKDYFLSSLCLSYSIGLFEQSVGIKEQRTLTKLFKKLSIYIQSLVSVTIKKPILLYGINY